MSATLSLRQLEEFDPQASRGGVERRFLCPLCGEGKPKDAAHRSLGANTETGAWLCHRCGDKGKLKEWWSEQKPEPQTPRQRMQRRLRQAFSLDSGGQSARVPISPPPAANSFTPSAFGTSAATPPNNGGQSSKGNAWRVELRALRPVAGTPAEAYLRNRGIPVEVAHAAGVRFSPSWFGSPAAVFPVRDENGRLVAAQGRYLREGTGPKARTAGDKKAGVFISAGLWEEVKRGAPVVVCEAPIDALSIAACGYPALALCGKDGWPSWLAIKCAFKSVALAFDADDAGDAGAAKLEQALVSLGGRPFRLRPQGGKDWNELLQLQGQDTLTEILTACLL